MKPYELVSKQEYENYIKRYRKIIQEGKEAEAFLGEVSKYRFRQRDSLMTDYTDIDALIEYCLFPMYAEGDTDIARRTLEILKDFASSDNIMKLYQAAEYLYIQDHVIRNFRPLPFMIDGSTLVPPIIDRIDQFPEDQKDNYFYQQICGTMNLVPAFRAYDKERVDQIVNEYKARRAKNKKPPVKSIAEVWPVVFDMTRLDALDIVDDSLELLLEDKNQWIPSLEEEHLSKLLEKINKYLHYIENKEYMSHCKRDFSQKVIFLRFDYHVSKNGKAFLNAVAEQLADTDVRIKVEMPK